MTALPPAELERIRNGPPRPCPGCGAVAKWITSRTGWHGYAEVHPPDCLEMVRWKDLDRFYDELGDGEAA